MSTTTQIAIRLEDEILKRIQSSRDRFRDNNRGIQLSRADAIRLLLVRGLEADEQDAE